MIGRATTESQTASPVVAVGLAICMSLGTGNGLLPDFVKEQPRFATGWLSSEHASTLQVFIPPVVTPASAAIMSSVDLLDRVHSQSGLTWEQIARLFNVSRRSVHLWLAGGRMSATNEERLIAVERYVSSIDAEPSVRRHQMLAGNDSGPSFFDLQRHELSSRSDDINRHIEPLVDAE